MSAAPDAIDRVRHFAARQPDAPAVLTDDGRVSYAELIRQVNALAGRLAAAEPAGSVAVWLPPGVEATAALLACLATRTPFVWCDSGSDAQHHRTEQLCGATMRLVAGPGVPLVPTGVTGEPPNLPPDVACALFTSGSTGEPKALLQRRRNLEQLTDWFATAHELGPGRTMLQWARLSYDASYVEILATLRSGATLLAPSEASKSDPAALIELLRAHRATHIQLVPSIAGELVRALDSDPAAAPLETVRVTCLAGEAVTAGLGAGLRRWLPASRLVNLFGPSECILATVADITAELADPVPIGRAIPGRDVTLRARPDGDDDTGEICVRTEFLAAGYLDSAGLVSPVGQADRDGIWCYPTGDLGRRRPDGSLLFLGRIDDQVKLRGARIQPQQIEAVLSEHPGVAAAAVVVNGDGAAARLVAWIVPAHSGQTTAPAVLREFLRERLPVTHVPAAFETVDGLPRTVTGKVDRRRLAARLPAAVVPSGDSVAPAGATYQAVAAVWAETLGLSAVDPDGDFFDLGGHSLLALKVCAVLGRRLDVEIPMRVLFEHPTLRDLWTAIERQLTGSQTDTPQGGP